MDKIVATGGRAIPFAATYWVIIKKQAAIKTGGEKVGFKVKLTLKKNKLREPFGEVYYNVKFRESLDFCEDTLELFLPASFCGLKKSKKGYFSDELGVPDSNALTAQEMYNLIHSPEHIEKFQEELDIILNDHCLKYTSPQSEEEQPVEETDLSAQP
jgi:RecA/RadA recombinase